MVTIQIGDGLVQVQQQPANGRPADRLIIATAKLRFGTLLKWSSHA